jgi:hypothetical protein
MITPEQANEMLHRLEKNKKRETPTIEDIPIEGVAMEIVGLHVPIIRWCQQQVPAVPFYHSRSDKAATIDRGAPDFCLIYKGKPILIECKSKTGKLTEDQRNWIYCSELQGVTVHIIRSMEEFFELVK